eukprot:CAMPEP_0204350794 /NCGR_PEP_ID=MMETSP0469-20131031/30619_1 /ASSEMBLY_ACC=CAM_ASM_000384 /TAXON_ID=2969 /ORGANISM="Oxyrrhis marina" /LENGTH=58 /DNA_ID=CAMNT_0051337213 /DNA_START=241 /DNA_END=414 /DNA_ORIENTATION=-
MTGVRARKADQCTPIPLPKLHAHWSNALRTGTHCTASTGPTNQDSASATNVHEQQLLP